MRNIFKKQKRSSSPVAFVLNDGNADDYLISHGYRSLASCPEIMTGVRKIAEVCGLLTIFIMENQDNGDIRIRDELARKLDVEPYTLMSRKTYMETIVMNLLLYGNGNSVVLPHTRAGLITDLEPIIPNRVLFEGKPEKNTYTAYIDGKAYSPDEILHFVLNPDREEPWRGKGLRVSLRAIADDLAQAQATKTLFLRSKYKPSIVVKVDALTDEFASQEGREKLLESYVKSSKAGEPWLIPAEQFQIDTIKPLTLADLQISDAIEVDKRMAAAILGVPPFILGIGNYNKEEWNYFINTTIKSITTGIAQEMTRKLILSPKRYIKFNIFSLLDWDLQTISSVFSSLSDRGFVTGNEVRKKIGLPPAEGLDEFRVLENYIPYDMASMQKKLLQGGEQN